LSPLKQKKKKHKEIEVSLFRSEHNDEVGFTVRSDDGSALTAQDILEAIADTLMGEYAMDYEKQRSSELQ
jgi:hypothetical protein